jgi:predicted glycosyltransferase
MNVKKVLFISGLLSLGQIGRDLGIAKALCKEHPGIDISWLAEDPTTMVLKDAGRSFFQKQMC